MARYIDADKIEYIKAPIGPPRKSDAISWQDIAFKDDIDNIIIADVQEVKHGKWEHKIQEMGIFKHHYIACPCCNAWFNIVNVHLLIGDGKLFDFCPSCGAKMVRGEEKQ